MNHPPKPAIILLFGLLFSAAAFFPACVLPQDPPAPAFLSFSEMTESNQITLAFAKATNDKGLPLPDTYAIGNPKTAKIYYTTDGSDPTPNSALYNFKPIPVTQNLLIKAIAVQEKKPHYLKPNAPTEAEKKLLWTTVFTSPVEYKNYLRTCPKVVFSQSSSNVTQIGICIHSSGSTLCTVDPVSLACDPADSAATMQLILPTVAKAVSLTQIAFSVTKQGDDFCLQLTSTPPPDPPQPVASFLLSKDQPKTIALTAFSSKPHWENGPASSLTLNISFEPESP